MPAKVWRFAGDYHVDLTRPLHIGVIPASADSGSGTLDGGRLRVKAASAPQPAEDNATAGSYDVAGPDIAEVAEE